MGSARGYRSGYSMVQQILKEHLNASLRESEKGRESELDFRWVSEMVEVVQTVLAKATDSVQVIQWDCLMVTEPLA
jgi:hypothetical protein